MEVARLCERRIDQSVKSYAQITRFAIPLVKNVKDVPVGENLITLDYTTASASRTDDRIILRPQLISETGVDCPDINPKKRLSRHRFIYGSGLHSRGFFANSLCKVNVETGELKVWKEDDGVFPGDPKFIPKPGSDVEDDGVLVAACADMRPTGEDFLIVLNATTMEEEGRAEFSHKFPQAIHSIFLPTDSN